MIYNAKHYRDLVAKNEAEKKRQAIDLLYKNIGMEIEVATQALKMDVDVHYNHCPLEDVGNICTLLREEGFKVTLERSGLNSGTLNISWAE